MRTSAEMKMSPNFMQSSKLQYRVNGVQQASGFKYMISQCHARYFDLSIDIILFHFNLVHETDLLPYFVIVQDRLIVGIQELAVEPQSDLLLGFGGDAQGLTVG